MVVSDTTPLNYLCLIGEIELIPALYERVLIPLEVHRELQRSGAPSSVRTWASQLPTWCEVRNPDYKLDADLYALDAGERDAIRLALEFRIETVITDDRDARREAESRNLSIIGTVSVLERAARRGLIDFRSTLEKLTQTNFRLSMKLQAEFLRRNP